MSYTTGSNGRIIRVERINQRIKVKYSTLQSNRTHYIFGTTGLLAVATGLVFWHSWWMCASITTQADYNFPKINISCCLCLQSKSIHWNIDRMIIDSTNDRTTIVSTSIVVANFDSTNIDCTNIDCTITDRTNIDSKNIDSMNIDKTIIDITNIDGTSIDSA